MDKQAKVATEEELKAMRHRCWSPPCKGWAFLKDGMGWNWCFKHWWHYAVISYDRPKLKDKWFYIRTTTIF